MQYHHLYADETGESRWRDVEVSVRERTFAPPAKAIEISDPVRAGKMLFLRLRAGWDEPAHASPIPQTLVCLRGTAIVTASDGTERTIGAGTVWRMEDTTGKGHHTRVLDGEDFECVIVQHV
ncbi:cupin [Defluviimonas aestuarii]|uniref:cupin n=1 Tax=Albidovulum aestuarii TaxID=1130726 RepID=UPI00249C32F1|nr:cupin [Defluviimonas aestuarii]MDI3335215.1 cupin [Defluviimonas aestuarii]